MPDKELFERWWHKGCVPEASGKLAMASAFRAGYAAALRERERDGTFTPIPISSDHSAICGGLEPATQPTPQPSTEDAVSILHKRLIGKDSLRQKQLDAERAWTFLEGRGFPNLDIHPENGEKRTLTELLCEYLKWAPKSHPESGQ